MPSKSTTTTFSEDAVRTQAYLLWEADGRPFGRDEHYWGLALAETATPAKPKSVAASAKSEPTKKSKPKASPKPVKAAKPAKSKAPVSKSKKSKA
jgi:hypothetical protein